MRSEIVKRGPDNDAVLQEAFLDRLARERGMEVATASAGTEPD